MNDPPLDFDVACIHCGYNLRGLKPDGLCPECATPIERSLRGDLLKFADPGWLERLRFGASLKLWHIGLTIVMGLAAGTLVGVGLPGALAVIASLIGAAIGLWASFVITTQEPRISLAEDTVTLRRVIRFCAVVAFLAAIIQQSAGMLPNAVVVVVNVAAWVGLIAWIGELVYFRRFALRIPDDKLAQSTRTLTWAIPITWGLGMIGMTVAAILTRGTGGLAAGAAAPAGAAFGIGASVLAFAGCAALLVGLLLLLWYVRLLTRYKKAFQLAHSEALAIQAPPSTSAQSPEMPLPNPPPDPTNT